MQVCTSLQTDNHASTPPLSFFTGRMPFLPPNQQRQSTECCITHDVKMCCKLLVPHKRTNECVETSSLPWRLRTTPAECWRHRPVLRLCTHCMQSRRQSLPRSTEAAGHTSLSTPDRQHTHTHKLSTHDDTGSNSTFNITQVYATVWRQCR